MMKLSIIGAGNVGATTAFIAAMRGNELGIDEVVLLDVVEKIPQGKALDISQSLPVFDLNVKIIGTTNYEDTSDSDIVVITAGLPRKPGMSRDDLIEKNLGIVKTVVENVIKYSENPWLIVVTNPLDAMAFAAKKISNSDKVIGMAGTLDSARFRCFIAQELGEEVLNVNAMTIGCHGDDMVPLISMAEVNGKPLEKFMSERKIKEIVERTQKGGAEIVELLGTSAYYAPAASVIEIIEAIDTEKIVPVSAEYSGVFIGVPAKLTDDSVQIQDNILGKMSKEEKELFSKSIEHMKELIKATEQILEKNTMKAKT